ncbi:MAG: aldehyde dehydrogenase family protein [Actinomycetota bacterium]
MPTLTPDTRLLSGAVVIGDDDIRSTSAGEMTHTNPATGREQASFPLAGRAEVDAAVAAARRAQPIWAGMPPQRRQAILRRIAELAVEHAHEFATINTLETGTPYAGFHAMIKDRFPAWFNYYAGWIEKLPGETSELGYDRPFNLTVFEPVGVVVKILTWNGPLNNIYMSVAPALAAGCTVVIKPPELAPFGAIRFAQLCREAGLPSGAVSVLPGGPETGKMLVSHPEVDKISFTGGTSTGKLIQASAGEALTPLVMELGGKSAHIVFADADLDRVAAQQITFCRLAGQVCTAPTRLLVQDSIYDETVERVRAAFDRIVVGDPFDAAVEMGPVINAAAKERISGMIDRAESTGATVIRSPLPLSGQLADGSFLPPMMVLDAAFDSEIMREEVFGPVVTVGRFSTEDEAIGYANDSRFGLAAYLHTRDISRALKAASLLEAGSIGINGGPAPASYAAPFGGVRQSGYGREGGREGIMEFLRTKNINIVLG